MTLAFISSFVFESSSCWVDSWNWFDWLRIGYRKFWCWRRTGNTANRPASSTVWAATRSESSSMTCRWTPWWMPCPNRCPLSNHCTPKCFWRRRRCSSCVPTASSCKWSDTSPLSRIPEGILRPTFGGWIIAARSYPAARSCSESLCSQSPRFVRIWCRGAKHWTRPSKDWVNPPICCLSAQDAPQKRILKWISLVSNRSTRPGWYVRRELDEPTQSAAGRVSPGGQLL